MALRESKTAKTETETVETPDEASVPEPVQAPITPAVRQSIVTPIDAALNAYEPGALGFGTVPRITVSNGLISDGEGNKLGSWLELELESFNDSYMVATGDSSEEAKQYLKFSYDPDVHSDGTPMAEYVQDAKDAGYDKTAVKHYVEMFGTLIDSDKKCEDLQDELVMLSLSPQSVKNFTAFRIQSAHKIKKGKMSADDLNVLRVSAKVRSFKTFTFSIFDFAVKPE